MKLFDFSVLAEGVLASILNRSIDIPEDLLQKAVSLQREFLDGGLPVNFSRMELDEVEVFGVFYLKLSHEARSNENGREMAKKLLWQMQKGLMDSARKEKIGETVLEYFCQGMGLFLKSTLGNDKSYGYHDALSLISNISKRARSVDGYALEWLKHFTASGTNDSPYLDRKLREYVLEFTGVDDGLSDMYACERDWLSENPEDHKSLEALTDMLQCFIRYFYQRGEINKTLDLIEDALIILPSQTSSSDGEGQVREKTQIALPWIAQYFMGLVQDGLTKGALSAKQTQVIYDWLWDEKWSLHTDIELLRGEYQAYSTLNLIGVGELELAHQAFEQWKEAKLGETHVDEFPWLIHRAFKSVNNNDRDGSAKRIQYLRLFIRIQKTQGPCTLRSCFLNHAVSVSSHWGAFPDWLEKFEGELFQEEDFTPWKIPNTNREVQPLVVRVGKGLYQSLKVFKRYLKKHSDADASLGNRFKTYALRVLAFYDQFHSHLENDPYFNYRYALVLNWCDRVEDAKTMLIHQAPTRLNDFWYWLAMGDLYQGTEVLRLNCLCRAIDIATNEDGKKFLQSTIRTLQNAFGEELTMELVRTRSKDALSLLEGQGKHCDGCALPNNNVVVVIDNQPLHVSLLPRLTEEESSPGAPVKVSLISDAGRHLATMVEPRLDGDLWDVFPEEITIVERVDKVRRVAHLWNEHNRRFRISTKSYPAAKVWKAGDAFLLGVEYGERYNRIRVADPLTQDVDCIRAFEGSMHLAGQGFVCNDGDVQIDRELIFQVNPKEIPNVRGIAFRPKGLDAWTAVTVEKVK